MSFSILTVCTGNICRSPVAEFALAQALGGFEEVEVTSAGTGALVGHGVPVQAQRLATASGIDASSHAARQIDPSLVRGADLILAMAREHRRFVVESLPAAMRRTFTLRELARIADGVMDGLPDAVRRAEAKTPEEGMRAAIALAAAMRGTVPPPASADDFDVIDPYRRDDAVYEQSFSELKPAADRVATFLESAAKLATSS